MNSERAKTRAFANRSTKTINLTELPSLGIYLWLTKPRERHHSLPPPRHAIIHFSHFSHLFTNAYVIVHNHRQHFREFPRAFMDSNGELNCHHANPLRGGLYQNGNKRRWRIVRLPLDALDEHKNENIN